MLRLPSGAHHIFLQLLANTGGKKINVLQILQINFTSDKEILRVLIKTKKKFIFSNCRAQNILALEKRFIQTKKKKSLTFSVIKTAFPLKQLVLVYGAALVRRPQRSFIC